MSVNEMLMAAAGTGGGDKLYVDDVFSTYLYTGNSSTQTITNGIDLAGKGGLVWVKQRGPAGNNHQLADTVRGASSQLASNTTAAATSETNRFTSFNSNGFSLDSGTIVNNSTQTYCSWTFREQAKFFDVVTYTGNGSGSGRTISHNLGSAPGMIILKVTNLDGDDWYVYHRSIPTRVLALNSTAVTDPSPAQFVFGNGTTVVAPTSTNFTIGSTVNPNGYTFVAYLFAHDAGGFGAAGTDNVISCGSYTGAASDVSVSLGYEPQYLLIKNASAATNWYMVDIMRGLYGTTTPESYLYPNSSNAEATDSNRVTITSTGFIARAGTTTINDTGNTYIYMAIRRPMKPPTSGTQVFSPVARTGTGADETISGLNAADVVLIKNRVNGTTSFTWGDRLRGQPYLRSSAASAETVDSIAFPANPFGVQSGVKVGNGTLVNSSSDTFINYFFRRATGFFDEVCYTGTGDTRTVAHNLGAAPELIIVKARANARNWTVYSAATGNGGHLILNDASSYEANSSDWNNTSPTSSVFTVGGNYTVNDLNAGMVAYLFASVAGVSKVGSYTGNGSSQTINCGFTAGARFVLIKRTDSTGDWVTLDTARGIVSGNDPFLQLNSAAAEVTGEDIVDPANSGFIVNSTTENINASGGTYIYLAIA